MTRENKMTNTPKLLTDDRAKHRQRFSELPLGTQELLTMLTYRRPAGSKTERKFVNRFLRPLDVEQDNKGNLWKTIGNSPILWSSHIDTVHRTAGTQPVMIGNGIISLSPKADSNCLGADCTVGVWIMMNMIRAGIPGTYIFHHGEEIGGIGSNYISDVTPDKIKGLQYAVAFDRKGYDEIITHQMSGRCASDDFGNSLIGALHPMGMKLSSGGTFTDTANYAHIIPECTNIAVGYFNQHTPRETLDVNHANDLLRTILTADFSGLICKRDPSEIEPDYGDIFGGYYGGQYYGTHGYSNRWPKVSQKVYDLTAPGPHNVDNELLQFVRSRPSLAAAFLDHCGFTKKELEDFDEQMFWNSQIR